MVVFTCDSCGTSLKKNQVENHCNFQCRNCQSVSCMDCNKVFWGNDYQDHTKCVSEDQRYGGKDFQPKASSNKGEIKQEKWIEHIKSTLATKKISGPLSGLLNQMILYSNIPRKQTKFENFLKNSLKIRSPHLIAEAWEIFAQGTKNEPDASSNKTTNANGITAVNGVNNGNSSEKRGADPTLDKTAKKACLEKSTDSKDKKTPSQFDWCKACEKILLDFPNGLSEKKLRKQVIANYKATVNTEACPLTDAELKIIFRNNVLNNPTFSLNVDPSKTS